MTAITRRRLLVAAALPSVARPVAAPAAEPSGDAAVLRALHRDEMVALAAYRAAARRPAPRVRGVAVAFRAHEFKHVAALATALEALGSGRFPPPDGAAALDREARRLGLSPVPSAWGSAGDVLGFLLDLERHLLSAWERGQARLQEETLVRTAGEVLACQAQHLVVLRGATGVERLPAAVDAGT